MSLGIFGGFRGGFGFQSSRMGAKKKAVFSGTQEYMKKRVASDIHDKPKFKVEKKTFNFAKSHKEVGKVSEGIFNMVERIKQIKESGLDQQANSSIASELKAIERDIGTFSQQLADGNYDKVGEAIVQSALGSLELAKNELSITDVDLSNVISVSDVDNTEIAVRLDEAAVSLQAMITDEINPQLQEEVMEVGEETPAVQNTDYNESYSETAEFDDGSYITIYQDDSNGGASLYAQRFDADGNMVGDAIAIQNSAHGDASASIMTHSDGSFSVSYTRDWKNGSADSIFMMKFDSDGNILSNTRLTKKNDFNQQNSEIHELNDGSYVVTYEPVGEDGFGTGIYAQRFDADGNTVGDVFRINQQVSGSQYNVDIEQLDNGNVIMSFASTDKDGDGSAIVQQVYDADFNLQSNELVVSQTTAGHQQNPIIQKLDDGGYMTIYESQSVDGDGFALVARKFDANGQVVGDEFQVSSRSVGDQVNASVASMADGSFVVAYESDGDIMAQRFDASGEKIDGEFLIAENATDVRLSELHGEILLSYQASDSSSTNVYQKSLSMEMQEASGEGANELKEARDQLQAVVDKINNYAGDDYEFLAKSVQNDLDLIQEKLADLDLDDDLQGLADTLDRAVRSQDFSIENSLESKLSSIDRSLNKVGGHLLQAVSALNVDRTSVRVSREGDAENKLSMDTLLGNADKTNEEGMAALERSQNNSNMPVKFFVSESGNGVRMVVDQKKILGAMDGVGSRLRDRTDTKGFFKAKKTNRIKLAMSQAPKVNVGAVNTKVANAASNLQTPNVPKLEGSGQRIAPESVKQIRLEKSLETEDIAVSVELSSDVKQRIQTKSVDLSAEKVALTVSTINFDSSISLEEDEQDEGLRGIAGDLLDS